MVTQLCKYKSGYNFCLASPFNTVIRAIQTINANSTIQGEAYTSSNGTQTQLTSDTGGGSNVGWIHSGNWLGYSLVDFGTIAATRFVARVASGAQNGAIGAMKVVLDSPTGAMSICSIHISNTGGWQSWTTISSNVSSVTRTHSVYLVFTTDQDYNLVNINWFTFSN